MAALAENVYSIIFLEDVSLSSFELPEDLLFEVALLLLSAYPMMMFPLFSKERNCFLVFR